jgi:hypothetical protein
MSQYFATLTGDELLNALIQRVRQWDQWLETSGVGARWSRSMKVYNGLKGDDGDTTMNLGKLRQVGRKGELTYLNTNHYRNLVQHVLVLVTSQRPAFQVRAANSDSTSQVQAQLGNGILDFYLREKKLEVNLKKAVEHAILWGEGHAVQIWNPALGEPYAADPVSGRAVKEGDVDTWNPLPNDVIRDTNAEDFERAPWKMVRFKSNKFDLAIRYSQAKDKILAAKADGLEAGSLRSKGGEDEANNDLVSCFWFFHEKTDALPEGKMVFMCEQAVLFEGPLAYKRIPLYTIMPSPIENTPVGYTPAFDALPVQEAVNILGSSILSNQKAFGVQNVWTKPNGGVTVTQLAGGLNLIESNEKPEPLQLCATPAEVPQFRTGLIGELETLMGVNSVVRGQPEASLKSGAALALVASQAVQFASGLQGGYNLLLEGLGSGTLRLLRQYAKTKRIATIVGVKGRSYQKDFVGDDLDAIDAVSVEQAPALAKTHAGNVEIANTLLQANMIKRPEEYLSVVLTGRLDPLVEDDSAKLMLIRRENETLIEGKPVRAIVTEHHANHISGHLNVLNSPEAKDDPGLVERTLAHVQEHLEQWRTASPEILMLTGQQPAPQPMMPPPPGGQGAPGTPIPQNPPQSEPMQAGMPSLPPNSPEGAQAAYEQMAGNAQIPGQ